MTLRSPPTAKAVININICQHLFFNYKVTLCRSNFVFVAAMTAIDEFRYWVGFQYQLFSAYFQLNATVYQSSKVLASMTR